jgi:hypothetical protein
MSKAMKLNRWQKKHLDSTRWLLLSGPLGKRKGFPEGALVEKNRQQGRSFLFAYVLIELAMERRGEKIYLVDHAEPLLPRTHSPHLRATLVEKVRKMVQGESAMKEFKGLPLEVNDQGWIRMGS